MFWEMKWIGADTPSAAKITNLGETAYFAEAIISWKSLGHL